jgi:hypothetical protein
VRTWWSISPLPTSSYTVVVERSSPLPAVPRCALILPLADCRTLLRLLLLLATAAARRCRCCLPCCSRCGLPCCARCCSPCVQQAAAALGACAELCCSLLGFSPHARGTCIRQGRKTKDTSRSVTCAAACLGYLSMCRRFWSHAKSRVLLGGTLGENAAWCSGHGSSAQADGCGLSPAAGPARHVVFCGHRSVFSSPPGRRMSRPLAFFPRTLIRLHMLVSRLPRAWFCRCQRRCSFNKHENKPLSRKQA